MTNGHDGFEKCAINVEVESKGVEVRGEDGCVAHRLAINIHPLINCNYNLCITKCSSFLTLTECFDTASGP